MQTSQEKSSGSLRHQASSPQSKLLKIDRDFDAPVERLFAAFKSSEAIQAWWWPKDLYADRVEFDFRDGGHYFINMKGFDRGGGGMAGDFEEIVENKRIVMTDNFADENGRVITAAEAKMPGVWPEVGYITLEFTAIDANTSRLSLSQEGIPNEMQDDCIQGWSQSFDKLDQYLAKAKQ